MSIINEFKKFINRGNAIDLAVAFILGASFGKIVNSLVNDMLMPPIGALLGGVDFSQLGLTVKGGAHPVIIRYGAFINTIIDFLIVSTAIFCLLKAINTFKRRNEEAPTSKECPECCMSIPVHATRCGHCTSHLKK